MGEVASALQNATECTIGVVRRDIWSFPSCVGLALSVPAMVRVADCIRRYSNGADISTVRECSDAVEVLQYMGYNVASLTREQAAQAANAINQQVTQIAIQYEQPLKELRMEYEKRSRELTIWRALAIGGAFTTILAVTAAIIFWYRSKPREKTE